MLLSDMAYAPSRVKPACRPARFAGFRRCCILKTSGFSSTCTFDAAAAAEDCH